MHRLTAWAGAAVVVTVTAGIIGGRVEMYQHSATSGMTQVSPLKQSDVIIKLGNGRTLKSVLHDNKRRQQVVQAVKRILAMKKPPSMDTSGFVQTVYKQVGLSVPRTIAEQGRFGQQVNGKKKLQLGDVVCFDLGTKPRVVTFDGIYIGSSKFAAVTTQGLSVISLKNLYWSPRYLFARRWLP